MASGGNRLEFVLNGQLLRIEGLSPQITLLEHVRSTGLTGAKEGCAEGECGACAMLLVQSSPAGTVYRSVNSCLVPLPAIAGQEVYTVEALAESGQLAEVQDAMARGGGSQCGFCTPGFVVSMFAEQHRPDGRPADFHELGGNLCRCTGYRPIRDAVLALGPSRDTPLTARLLKEAPDLTPMRYEHGGSSFVRPCDLAACLEAGSTVNSRYVAGNTDLGVLTNLRGERFERLISLEGISELRDFSESDSLVEIGAGLTLTEVGELWRTAPPVVRQWLHLFASPLIRNRATLGGNLATASPIGDSAPFLLALGSSVRIAGLSGERIVPLAEFFRGYRDTALTSGEILRSIQIPKPLPEFLRFYKVAKRVLDDISTVAMGIAVTPAGIQIGLGGVAAVPLAIRAATFEELATQVAKLQPLSDHRGSAGYRLAMVASLIGKFRYQTGR